MQLLIPLLLLGLPIAGFIWYEIDQRKKHGNYIQQARRKHNQALQRQMFIGEVDGRMVREAFDDHRRRR